MNQVTLGRQFPTGYSDRQMGGAFNSKMADALAMGDPRFQVKQLDRAGFSRGAAQRNQAGINAAQAMADGIAAAYQGAMDDQAYNSNLLLQGQQAQERNAQALAGLQQQDSYAQQMAQLQRQQAMMNFAGSLLGGLLG